MLFKEVTDHGFPLDLCFFLTHRITASTVKDSLTQAGWSGVSGNSTGKKKL